MMKMGLLLRSLFLRTKKESLITITISHSTIQVLHSLSDPMDSINAILFGQMAEDYLGCTEDKIYEAAKQIIQLQDSMDCMIQIKTAQDLFQGSKAHTINNIKPLTQAQEAALSRELTGAELSQTSTSDLEKT